MITVNKVLRARGKMLRNKANGPADCLVTEMLQCHPTRPGARWPFGSTNGLKASVAPRRRGKFYASCSSNKPNAKLENGLRGVPSDRTIDRVLHMVHDRLGGHAARWRRSQLKRLDVGAEREVNCEHMQALVTNIFSDTGSGRRRAYLQLSTRP